MSNDNKLAESVLILSGLVRELAKEVEELKHPTRGSAPIYPDPSVVSYHTPAKVGL